jgi:hypothetical protein
VQKYAKRGFGTVFSEICRHEPRCDHQEHLHPEMKLKIEGIAGYSSAQEDLGYGEVALPFGRLQTNGAKERLSDASDVQDGHDLDSYCQGRRVFVNTETGEEQFRSVVGNPPGWVYLLECADKWTYVHGEQSASTGNIDFVLSKIKNLPPVRWKDVDLQNSRRGNEYLPKCYMCTLRIDPCLTVAERPRVCHECEDLNASKRHDVVDLTGRTVVVTGGRCKIGYAVAVRLLRLGATVIITTRFPRTAAQGYAAEQDWDVWSDRLHIYGVDFRAIDAVLRLGALLASRYPCISCVINNAAQTVRRPRGWYQQLLVSEAAHISESLAARVVQVLSPAVPLPLTRASPDLNSTETTAAGSKLALLPTGTHIDTPLIPNIILPGDELSASIFLGKDADGEPLDPRPKTSWNAKMGVIHPVEFLEVQLVNVHAPWSIMQVMPRKPALL